MVRIALTFTFEPIEGLWLTSVVTGWSFGGVVAYEVARQLTIRGVDIKGLVLIDSPSPINHEPLPAAVIASIIRSGRQSEISRNLQEEFLSNASLLGSYKPELYFQVAGRPLKTVMLRSQSTLDTEALCGVRYNWLSEQETRDDAIVAWKYLVGCPIEVLPIPGNHFQPFLEDKVRAAFLNISATFKLLTRTLKIGETSAQLWEACRIIERA